MNLEQFADILQAKSVIDEGAVYDSENYDHGETMIRVKLAFAQITVIENERRAALESIAAHETETCRAVEEENAKLRELIVHCWVHSGYDDCGSKYMSEEQRALYNACTADNTPPEEEEK